MIYDGSKEQNGKNTEFQRIIHKYDIPTKTSEKERSNQNPSEGVIRELRKEMVQDLIQIWMPTKTMELWSISHI